MKPHSCALVLLLSCALFAAGCGGDDDEDGGGGSDRAGDKAEQTDGRARQSDAARPGTDLSDNPQVKRAVEQCKRNAETSPGLTDRAREQYKEICEKSAQGDAKAVREAAREVCLEQARAAPEGPAREAAEDACRQATAGR
jgi:hypothetical protein